MRRQSAQHCYCTLRLQECTQGPGKFALLELSVTMCKQRTTSTAAIEARTGWMYRTYFRSRRLVMMTVLLRDRTKDAIIIRTLFLVTVQTSAASVRTYICALAFLPHLPCVTAKPTTPCFVIVEDAFLANPMRPGSSMSNCRFQFSMYKTRTSSTCGTHNATVICHSIELSPHAVEQSGRINSKHIVPLLISELADSLDSDSLADNARQICRTVQLPKLFDRALYPPITLLLLADIYYDSR